jgi:hypothetical protein
MGFDHSWKLLNDIKYLVPKVGLEPTRPCGHWILSPARLPFHHSGIPPNAMVVASANCPKFRLPKPTILKFFQYLLSSRRRF